MWAVRRRTRSRTNKPPAAQGATGPLENPKTASGGASLRLNRTSQEAGQIAQPHPVTHQRPGPERRDQAPILIKGVPRILDTEAVARWQLTPAAGRCLDRDV
jgi:hypothetical protein